jgi:hypothetical protein
MNESIPQTDTTAPTLPFTSPPTAQPDGAKATAPNPFAERAAAEAGERSKKPSLLSTVTFKKRRRPLYAVLYGPPGIGKSTFGSTLPKPIFIHTERGLDQITTPRFPIVRTLDEYKLQIQALLREDHDYQSVVIDTIDGLDLLVQTEVCDEGKCDSIESYAGGYGKGWNRAREIWVKILDRLTDMSERWNILLISHAQIKTITDPAVGTPFDQWKMRVSDKSQDVIKQSIDLLLFVNLVRTVSKDSPRARKGRAIVSQDREMWTAPTTGIECKNRFGLPNPMPFSWPALETAIEEFHK